MLAACLRQLGHDVVYMAEAAPRTSDPEVLSWSARENRLLLTEDKDFGELIFRLARPVPGIVLIRIDPARRLRKPVRLLAAINRFGDELLGRYTVVEDSRFRSRALRSK